MNTLKTLPTLKHTALSASSKDIRTTRAWRRLRETILERDKFTCQSCGIISMTLEVDHINTDATNNDPINLQTLCKPCHLKKTTYENSGGLSYLEHSQKIRKLTKYK